MKRYAIALAAASLFAFGANAQQASGNLQGEAKSGDKIAVENIDNGFKREITVEEDGKYSIRRLPTGKYIVTQTHADGTAEKPKQIVIQVGTTARVK
jgi:hypothetical protein